MLLSVFNEGAAFTKWFVSLILQTISFGNKWIEYFLLILSLLF